jgi:hypothetical protein
MGLPPPALVRRSSRAQERDEIFRPRPLIGVAMAVRHLLFTSGPRTWAGVSAGAVDYSGRRRRLPGLHGLRCCGLGDRGMTLGRSCRHCIAGSATWMGEAMIKIEMPEFTVTTTDSTGNARPVSVVRVKPNLPSRGPEDPIEFFLEPPEALVLADKPAAPAFRLRILRTVMCDGLVHARRCPTRRKPRLC